MYNEEWKDVVGFEGYYQVSNYGRVKGQYGKILATLVDTRGTTRMCLSVDRVRTYTSIHRLVAQAFIPNPDNLPVVMHLDDNPRNNHVSNLQWGTQRDNIYDMISKGRANRGKANYKHGKYVGQAKKYRERKLS